MARTIDDAVQTHLESPARTDILLCFLTVTDPARPTDPARIVMEENGNVPMANGAFVNWYLNGNLFYGLPYRFTRMTDDDRPSRAQLLVPTYTPIIVEWFRKMDAPARMRFEAYSSSAWLSALDADNARSVSPSPDVSPELVYLADHIWLRHMNASITTITLELGGYDFTQEGLGPLASKQLCPDLYR